MRFELSVLAAAVACLAPVVSAGGPPPPQWTGPSGWGSSSPVASPPAYSTSVLSTPSSSVSTATPTWGTVVSSGWIPQNTTGPIPTSGGVVSSKTWHSAPVPTTTPTAAPSTFTPPVASATAAGGAAAYGPSLAGLMVAGGMAVLAL